MQWFCSIAELLLAAVKRCVVFCSDLTSIHSVLMSKLWMKRDASCFVNVQNCSDNIRIHSADPPTPPPPLKRPSRVWIICQSTLHKLFDVYSSDFHWVGDALRCLRASFTPFIFVHSWPTLLLQSHAGMTPMTHFIDSLYNGTANALCTKTYASRTLYAPFKTTLHSRTYNKSFSTVVLLG